MKHFWYNNKRLDKKPQRIVSLVPSQTELLYDLGLEKEIVGISKFCVHPEHLRKEKTIIGGTKQVHIDKITALEADLIIGNKEENSLELIDSLQDIAPIFISDIENLEDNYSMIESIGEMTDTLTKAQAINQQIKDNFKHLSSLKFPKKKVAYFIWKDPYMVVGNQNFIDHLFQYLNFENIFFELNRYPEIDFDDERWADVDYILLSSEPYPFQEKHKAEFQEKVPHAEILLVDGEYFSWYGSRMIDTPKYFEDLLKRIHQ